MSSRTPIAIPAREPNSMPQLSPPPSLPLSPSLWPSPPSPPPRPTPAIHRRRLFGRSQDCFCRAHPPVKAWRSGKALFFFLFFLCVPLFPYLYVILFLSP